MSKDKLLFFDLQNKASAFRKKNGYGETDPIRLDSFLLKNNILTLFRPLFSRLAGMAIKAGTNDMFMMINHTHSLGKQHFTIAHELYHILFRKTLHLRDT